MSHSIMQSVQDTLENLGLSFLPQPKETKAPYKACIIDFGIDEFSNPVALQVLLYSPELEKPPGTPSSGPEAFHLSVLSFVMTIPAVIQKEYAEEVMRLIALANKGIPLGAINYSEIEQSTYYSYSLPIFDVPPTEAMVLTIIHTAIFVKDTFSTFVYEVSSGKKSVEQLLKEANLLLPTDRE